MNSQVRPPSVVTAITVAEIISGDFSPEHGGPSGSCAGRFSDVDRLAETVAAAVGMFAGTNVDDMIVLTALFLSARTIGSPRRWQIWIGQYAGFAVLVLVAMAAALGLTIVPNDWVGLLGLVPFAFGVKGLAAAIRTHDDGREVSPAIASGLVSVATVTIANGADNISVYAPVFRTMGIGPSGVTVMVFAVGVALWCLAGSWLGSHKKIIAMVGRYDRWLVPTVFITIGSVIVIESGALTKVF
jgi:cadmium resistance transport/sequestration family protein